METLGIQCAACGTKRRHKSLRYHPQSFAPYCENPYVCTEQHPNSPVNIIRSQKQVALLQYEEAKALYTTSIVSESSDRVSRLLSNPLTVRITSVDMAQFLVRHSDQTGKNISELVRYFIHSVMAQYDVQEVVEEPKPKVVPAKIDDDDLIF